MSRKILGVTMAVALAAPLLAMSTSRVPATGTSAARDESWCESQNCPGGPDGCVEYEYPGGGTLRCLKTINQT